MIELKKPSLKGTKDSEKIEELRRYLFALIDDLQFALQDLEKQINVAKTAQAAATVAYTLATPDAVAYDGEAYSGEEMPIETMEEIIEEGEEDEHEHNI